MVAAAMMACLCSGLEWVCVVFSAAAKSGVLGGGGGLRVDGWVGRW